MKTQILFRNYRNEEEMAVAKRLFSFTERRTECKDSRVIARYSALPYYKELELDLAVNNSKLINSYRQHRWIANFDYYDHISHLTFTSWNEDTFSRSNESGPFVVKGKTNSRKSQWNSHMFAPDKDSAYRIANELRSDMFLADQGVIFRKYIPLKTFEIGINGQRFCNEWRVFYLNGERLTYGYYWAIADDIDSPRISEEGLVLADRAAKICSHIPFFCVDVAEKEEGGWIVVEINDGQMAGLCTIDPEIFYERLKCATESIVFGSGKTAGF